MTKIQARLRRLEKRIAGGTCSTLPEWIDFIRHIRPDGANWNVIEEARALERTGCTVADLVDAASNQAPTLPNIHQRKIETGELPPSQWLPTLPA